MMNSMCIRTFEVYALNLLLRECISTLFTQNAQVEGVRISLRNDDARRLIMDQYTQKTKSWLDQRFKKCDQHRIYYAHQPIYGFRKGHSEPFIIARYIRTYQIMKALSRLEFDSLLDVGGAEGYTAYIVKRLFNAKVRNSDLSEEACKRAGEIFDIESITADIHDLPFKNNEFDVVLCSETLEHVADLDRAIGELLKVASKAVVITVPYEPREVVDKNVEEQIPHGHLHHFDLKSFNFLQSYGHHILSRKMVSPLLMIHAVLMEAEPIPEEYCEKMRLPEIFTDIYNASMPILRKLFGKKTAAFLIALDDFVCKFTPFHNTILFVVLKDNRCYRREEIPKISAYQIINLGVPYHYVEKSVD